MEGPIRLAGVRVRRPTQYEIVQRLIVVDGWCRLGLGLCPTDRCWRRLATVGVGRGLSPVRDEVAATLRADDLDPQIARYAFDEGQAAFANARVALGSCAVCCGWVIASTRFLPRWVGWLAIASGAGLALSRISWTSYIWLPFYLMFWLWVSTVAVLLLRRNFRGAAPSG